MHVSSCSVLLLWFKCSAPAVEHQSFCKSFCLDWSLDLNPGFIRVGWFDSPESRPSPVGRPKHQRLRSPRVSVYRTLWSARVGRTLITLSLLGDLLAEPLRHFGVVQGVCERDFVPFGECDLGPPKETVLNCLA